MRGDHSGFEGKVSRIDLKRYRIFVEGLTREKVDGTNIFVAVHPSKVVIRSLNLDDKWRKAIVDRRHELEPTKKAEKPAPEPEKKPVEPKGEELAEKATAVSKAEKTREAKKTAQRPRVTQKKPVSKKEEKASTTEKKPIAGKKLAKTSTKKEKVTDLKTKSETAAKKTSRKPKTSASKKEGGT
jgi:ribosomal protein L24